MRLQRSLSTDELILALVFTGAVQFSEDGFSLKVHRDHPDLGLPLSPYYVNLRVRPKGPLEKWQAQMFGQNLGFWLWQRIPAGDGSPVQIVGIPNTGKPLAQGTVEAWQSRSPAHLLEMFKRGKGKGVIVPRLDGDYDSNKPIILVDDVIAEGGSKIETIQILRKLGLKVDRVAIIVDREQGGREKLEAEGVELIYLVTFGLILERCYKLGLIDSEMYSRCCEYPDVLDAAIAVATQG